MPYESIKYQQGHRNYNRARTTKAALYPTWRVPVRLLDAIPGSLVWIAFFVCIASAVAVPRILLLIAALVGCYSALRFVLAGLANLIGLYQIRQWEQRNWQAYHQQNATSASLRWDDVHHVVLIPNYKEPTEMLRETLDSLRAHPDAQRDMTVVLAMEAAEADSHAKATELVAAYDGAFANLLTTVHPNGLPNEMQCKSANIAWAVREAQRKLVNELGYNLDHICVTTMDADTQWHPSYFSALTAHFALDPQRHRRFWQAPIRYHGHIWSINPLLRIVNAYATAMELAYLAAPWWKALPMSSYSLSLRLLHESGYWDGDVIADEWHMFIKAYFATDGAVAVEPIMLPFLADVTRGNGLLAQIRERYLQTLRHAWGSKEISYMLVNIIDQPHIKFWSSLQLLGRIAHDVLMAGAGWVILTLGSQLPILLHPEIAPIDLATLLDDPQRALNDAFVAVAAEPSWTLILSAGLVVVVIGALFWLLDVLVRPARPHKPQLAERIWTILSFPLLPVMTLIVLAFPVIQAQTRLMLGLPLQFRVSKKT